MGRRRQVTRPESRRVRRKAFYLGLIRDRRSCELSQAATAFDYVRALLNDADPDLRGRVGEHVTSVLLSVAATLETEMEGARR